MIVTLAAILAFGLIPLKPEWSASIFACIGLLALATRVMKPVLLVPALLFGVLGGLAHLVSISTSGEARPVPADALQALLSQPADVPAEYLATHDRNLVTPGDLAWLRAWNPSDGTNGEGRLTADGYWRIERVNSETGRENSSFFVRREVPVEPATWYTTSLFFRHDGDWADFDIVFVTHRGEDRVPASTSVVSEGILRAHASFLTDPRDHMFLRQVELKSFRGNWTYLEIALVQLEQGNTPSPYGTVVAGPRAPLAPGLVWWFGAAGLVFVVLHGLRYSLNRANPRLVAASLFGGLAVHTALALVQVGVAGIVDPTTLKWLAALGLSETARASGLTVHPNLLAHGGLASAALVWVLAGRSRVAAAGVGLSGALVVLAASRTALVGWLLGVVGIAAVSARRRAGRWLPMVLLTGFVLLAVFTLAEPGRMAIVLGGADSAVEARIRAWGLLVDASRERPWFGFGALQTEAYLTLQRVEGQSIGHVTHAHNLILHFLAESGVTGLAGLFILLTAMAMQIARSQHRSALVVLAVALLLNTTDYTFFAAEVLVPVLAAVAWSTIEPRVNTAEP
jgi:O-antigen ligase